jgi:hypothetical protein
MFTQPQTPVDDVNLLMDIADAFKHHRPDRKSATVDVSYAFTTRYGGYPRRTPSPLCPGLGFRYTQESGICEIRTPTNFFR